MEEYKYEVLMAEFYILFGLEALRATGGDTKKLEDGIYKAKINIHLSSTLKDLD